MPGGSVGGRRSDRVKPPFASLSSVLKLVWGLAGIGVRRSESVAGAPMRPLASSSGVGIGRAAALSASLLKLSATGFWSGLKVMLSCWLRRSVTRQTERQLSVLPPSANPFAGLTCRVTFVPGAKLPTHWEPHWIPAGLLLIVPFPSRRTTSETRFGAASGWQPPMMNAPPVAPSVPHDCALVVELIVATCVVAVLEPVPPLPLPGFPPPPLLLGSVDVTVTVKEPRLVMLALLVALQLTVVVPSANVEPEEGLQLTATFPSNRSVAEAS